MALPIPAVEPIMSLTLHFPNMLPIPPNAVIIDVLNGLLEGVLNSVFRFVETGSPYLSRANAEIRRPLHEMVESNQRHARELSILIDSLNGVPLPPSVRPEEQYLAFLSLKFLLPKLVQEKRLMIERYENALRAIPKASQEIKAVLQRHIQDHREHIEILEKAAQDVLKNATGK